MASKVDIYAYTAANNPYFVKSLAHSYGYEFDKDQPLASVLQQLVSYEGEPVLTAIIENNPDKDLFMDYFEKKYGKKPEGCTCATSTVSNSNSMLGAYMNFSGQIQAQQSAENKSITSQTNLMILSGAVLIAFAIIMTKK